ncbi:hypothetical protein Vadar_021881 [Vaccinium darrowii]|uniref:Uncharacterized protein n=1 Tax=Vaccinium darrowii TaxID=229202 RepID=A0ACB7ZKN3_9ERIC|nr:hypothetical protein Vadar_021881 [Vaccinium darrowii]
MQIARSLRSAGALKSSSPDPSLAEFLNSPDRFSEVLFKLRFLLRRRVSMEVRNIGLVVAALIATATFQVVLSPPGGVGGPGDNSLFTNGTNINATVSSTNNLFAANTSFINATLLVPSEDPVKRLLFNGAINAGATRLLGVVRYGSVFCQFYALNTVAFVLSMLMIMFVLPFRPFAILHGALYCLMWSYGFSFPLISPSDVYSLYFMVTSVVCAALIFAARSATILMCQRNKRLQMLERLMMNSVGK